jgi:phosphoglycolate phosphatase
MTTQTSEYAPKLVMLDYDGVIVDSRDVTCRITAEVFRKYGLERLATANQILGFLHMNWYEALARAGVPQAVVQAVDDAIEQTVMQDPQSTPPVDGMLDVLRTLAHRHTVAIVTSARASSVFAFLDRYALDSVVDVLGADPETSKARKIAKLLQRFPGACERWLVTDTVGDVREAGVAGVRSIGVAWGWHPAEELREAGADRSAHSPADLLSLL